MQSVGVGAVPTHRTTTRYARCACANIAMGAESSGGRLARTASEAHPALTIRSLARAAAALPKVTDHGLNTAKSATVMVVSHAQSAIPTTYARSASANRVHLQTLWHLSGGRLVRTNLGFVVITAPALTVADARPLRAVRASTRSTRVPAPTVA